jgi:catechol 2,3-dioxygenase-like lactoylglutathione lyase family enzyme
MPSISQHITFLYTRDLKTTINFYENILGLRLARDQGDCKIYHLCGDSYVGFCERESAPEKPQGVLLTLVTDEVDEWFGKLNGVGIPVDKTPVLNPKYGIYHCFVRDPNGYVIEIQRFEEPLR